MVRLFDRLVARGVVESIRLESGGWTAQWPCWTKNWLEPDWDGDTTLPALTQAEETNKQSSGLNSFQAVIEALPTPPLHLPPEAPEVRTAEQSTVLNLCANISQVQPIVGELRDVEMPDAPEVITIDDDDVPRQTFSHAPGFNLNMVGQSQDSVTSFNPSIINFSGPVPPSSFPSAIPSSTSFNPTLTKFPQTTANTCTSFNPLFVPAGLQESLFASVRTTEQPTFQPGHFQPQQSPLCQYPSSQQLDENVHRASRLANVQTLTSSHATAPLVSQAVLPASCSGISTGNIGYAATPRDQTCSAQTPILQDTVQQSALTQLPPAQPLISAQQQYAAHPQQPTPQQHILLHQLTQQLIQQQLAQPQKPGSLTDTPSLTSWNPTIICFKEPESSNARTIIAGSAGDGSYCPTILSNGNDMPSYCPSIIHKSRQVEPAVRLAQITEVEESHQEPVDEQVPLPTTPLQMYRPLTPATTPAPPSRADRVDTWRREVTPARLFDPVKAKRELYVLISSAKDIKTQIKEAHGQAILMNLNQALLAIQEMRRKVKRESSPKFLSVLANTLIKPAISDANILKGSLDRVQTEILAHKGRLVSESLGEGKWHGRRHDGASSVDDALWM